MASQIPVSRQATQSKYVKVWEGSLSGLRQQQPVFITRLEGYRSYSASDSLASNWPPTMEIVHLISQDHMNNKQYVGKADFLVFKAMNPHGFLAQLQEKKLFAVIQLPSQTLLLSVSDKVCRLIGMLFPGDIVAFKPRLFSQQLQHHQQMQSLHLPQLQHEMLKIAEQSTGEKRSNGEKCSTVLMVQKGKGIKKKGKGKGRGKDFAGKTKRSNKPET